MSVCNQMVERWIIHRRSSRWPVEPAFIFDTSPPEGIEDDPEISQDHFYFYIKESKKTLKSSVSRMNCFNPLKYLLLIII